MGVVKARKSRQSAKESYLYHRSSAAKLVTYMSDDNIVEGYDDAHSVSEHSLTRLRQPYFAFFFGSLQ